MNTKKIWVARTDGFNAFIRTHEEKICTLLDYFCKNIDEESEFQARRLFKLYNILPTAPFKKPLWLEVPLYSGVFSSEEIIILENFETILDECRQAVSAYNLMDIDVTLQHMYFESGLKLIPYNILQNFSGKVCLDIGAYNGDSLVPLVKYGFSRIYAVEPSATAINNITRFIEINGFGNIFTVKTLVSDEVGQVGFWEGGQGSRIDKGSNNTAECTTVDTIVAKSNESVGLIKMDIEGSELYALFGAKQTIIRDKPVLLISAYHVWIAPLQMFEIKHYIESLLLGYKFMFKCLQPEGTLVNEYMLIAWVDDSNISDSYLNFNFADCDVWRAAQKEKNTCE